MGRSAWFLRTWYAWEAVFALVPTRIGGGGHATYFLRAYAGAPVAQTLRLSLLRCGERLCDTLRALPENVATPYAYWSKRAVLSTLRWRDNTAPFAVCFSLPLSLQPMQKYLRNILEKHCSGRPHNLRWSYHAIRPEGQPQMRNHYYKYLLCILLLIVCVLLVILAVLSNNNRGNEKDGTASTHAPSNTSTYWDKDRMESASPAPMPQ